MFACAESAPSSTDTDSAANDVLAQEEGSYPTPASVAGVWGFGIGVTDVPNAVKFYTEVMKMTVEKENVKREDRTETVLYATTAKRGARVILMKYDDGRNTRKITTKLVFQASNAGAVNSAARSFPDYKSRLNLGIVQFDGPDTYIHEVGGIFDNSGGSIRVPYPIALGFACSNHAACRKFYQAIGMKESPLGTFSVTDATGRGSISEVSERFTEGAGIVLQQWTPARNAKDNPVKVVFTVPDAKAMGQKVVSAGGTIVQEAERSEAYDSRLLVVAKDADGYLLEFVQ